MHFASSSAVVSANQYVRPSHLVPDILNFQHGPLLVGAEHFGLVRHCYDSIFRFRASYRRVPGEGLILQDRLRTLPCPFIVAGCIASSPALMVQLPFIRVTAGFVGGDALREDILHRRAWSSLTDESSVNLADRPMLVGQLSRQRTKMNQPRGRYVQPPLNLRAPITSIACFSSLLSVGIGWRYLDIRSSAAINRTETTTF